MTRLRLSAPKNFLKRPIDFTKKFFKHYQDCESCANKPARMRSGFFFKIILSAVSVWFMMDSAPQTAEAKPGPFYRSSSAFAYFLMSPTDGMSGGKTNFWVREAGVSYKSPYSLQMADRVSVTPVLMALGGVTRAADLAPAETNFGKLALTTNITYGKSTLGLGIRGILAQSLPWSFQAGPRTVSIPSENYVDLDLGARYSYRAGRTDTDAFIRSAGVELTRFNARWTIREPYYVAKGSLGFPQGWGTDFFYDSRNNNFGADLSKTFVWDRGQKMVFVGVGYEPVAKSVTGYAGGMYKDVMVMFAYQTEGGVPSYHFLLDYSLGGLFESVFGGSQK